MTTVAFDTLRFSQRLAEAGLAGPQAAGVAAATAEAVGELVAQLATKSDLALLRQELRAEQAALRQELRTEQAALRQELRTDISALRHEVKGDIAQLELRMTIKLGSMMAAAVALTAALTKLL
jgi:hypothetical protein